MYFLLSRDVSKGACYDTYIMCLVQDVCDAFNSVELEHDVHRMLQCLPSWNDSSIFSSSGSKAELEMQLLSSVETNF